jgi:hypothetical protein
MVSLNQHFVQQGFFNKLILFLFIICLPVLFTDCAIRKPMTQQEKSAKVKKKLDKKKERNYERARKKALKAHYERQGPDTKARMERRAAESENWRTRHSSSRQPSFWFRVKRWFRNLFRKADRPNDGLFGNDKINKAD